MKMTLTEAMQNIGKRGTIQNGPLTIDVTIVDFKNSYGKDRWLIEPVAGSGKAWVETVTINEDAA